MAAIEEQDVRIKANDGVATCDGVFSATHYTSHDRLVRALKALGAMWGLAIVAVFIPLAHFVLVPAFLIAGPVVARGRYKTSVAANDVVGACPSCKQNTKLLLQPADRLPMWKYCPKCNAPIQIDVK